MELVYNGHRLEVDLDYENSSYDDGVLVNSIVVCGVGGRWKEVLHRLRNETVEEIAELAWDIETDRNAEEMALRPSDFFFPQRSYR